MGGAGGVSNELFQGLGFSAWEGGGGVGGVGLDVA